MNMSKAILAASLLAAACDSSEPAREPDGGSDDPDAGAPIACTTAAECESGYACDLVTHECVSGALTIDPTEDVLVANARWWTTVSNPLVRGTFEGTSEARIVVAVGGREVSATLGDATWSAQLPADSVDASGTWVTVTLHDTGGRTVEAGQRFQLDALAPRISLLPSPVRDERGDTIDFSTGEPVHTHAGAELDLSTGSCPSVYRYAYLLAGHDPVFGAQTTRNSLGWMFEIVDTNLTDVRYRVRGASDEVLLGWQPARSFSSLYRVELRTTDVPALAAYSGQLFVDVVARDWTGREASSTACIDYHAMAAPLQIEEVKPATSALGGEPALAEMTLAADSPVSHLAGTGLGAAIASQRIVQYAAEPIELSLQGAIANLKFARTYVDDYVAVATGPGTGCQAGCSWQMPADPDDATTGGPAQTWAVRVALVDEAANRIIETVPPTIPARLPGDSPRAYRLVAYLGQLADLRPEADRLPAEHTLAGLTYTGLAPDAPLDVCTEIGVTGVGDRRAATCTTMTTFRRMIALDRASLQWDGITIGLATRPPGGAVTFPTYVDGSVFALPGASWDSGDDDLPGPK